MGNSTMGAARRSALQEMWEARAKSDRLLDIVRPEALYERPIAERHRIIFYLGHLEAFDWNLFGPALTGLNSFAPELDKLFAFGIDPVNGGLPDDQPKDWPAHNEVLRYRKTVRDSLDERLAPALESPEDRRTLAQLLHVAIEHRLMHAETLAYMLHRLPINLKCARQAPPAPRSPQVRPRMVEIPAGAATLGMKRSDDGAFGWDNEFDERRVSVPAFRIDAFMVTNRQYLRFVAEGGYSEPSFWGDADWQWLQSNGTLHPAFWARRENQFFFRTMFDEVPLPSEWPVYVSHAEALAYSRWARKELPSEAEWHRAAYGTHNGGERIYPWGDEPPAAGLGNFDFQHWDPTPVAAFPAGNSAFGASDLLGNGWEWTRTVFAPFEGFEPFPFYPGYSANFFDGQHYVMKGGSARTAACMLRRSFRNWFQPHYPFAYAGFRCVEH